MRPTNTMSTGLHLPVHHWRPNRYHPSKLLPRYRPTRHLLCSSPLPLRAIHRSSICNPSRLHPLIPPIHRVHPPLNVSQNSLRSNIRGCESNLLPPTLPRPGWHATTILRLPRRLYTMKRHLLSRIPHLPNSRNHASVHHLRSLRI